MKTVGEALKELREGKYYSLEEVEKATKIRRELLKALEDGDYQNLPPATFVQGFIKNYAKFLGTDSDNLLAIFRREYYQQKDHPQPRVMEAFADPVRPARFKLTPTRVIGSVVALVVIIFFAYLWIQYHQFVGAPRLEVKTPPDQQVVDQGVIMVEGKTDPESRVSINNQDIVILDNGEFKEEVKLISAVNKISIVSTNKIGQRTQIERTVYVRTSSK